MYITNKSPIPQRRTIEKMKVQYVFSASEVEKVRSRLRYLQRIALISRDAGDTAGNREFYLKAKGFEEALTMLGIEERTEQ